MQDIWNKYVRSDSEVKSFGHRASERFEEKGDFRNVFRIRTKGRNLFLSPFGGFVSIAYLQITSVMSAYGKLGYRSTGDVAINAQEQIFLGSALVKCEISQRYQQNDRPYFRKSSASCAAAIETL